MERGRREGGREEKERVRREGGGREEGREAKSDGEWAGGGRVEGVVTFIESDTRGLPLPLHRPLRVLEFTDGAPHFLFLAVGPQFPQCLGGLHSALFLIFLHNTQ